MKFLITGGAGQLGQELARLLPAATAVDVDKLDVTDEDAVWRAFTRHSVNTVIHCAAMTNVDACELDPAQARRVNAVGTRHVATVCGSLGIYLIAISTDYVFDGHQGRVLTEDLDPRPISVYGKTKFEGETAVRELCRHHAIVRTSWLYGDGNKGFVAGVLRNGVGGTPMKMTSQISNPTWARDLAPALVELARQRAVGTFHLTNEGGVTRDNWAREILNAGNLDPGLIETVESFPAPAKRPRFSSLTNIKARQIGITMRPWKEALGEFISTNDEIGRMLTNTWQPVG